MGNADEGCVKCTMYKFQDFGIKVELVWYGRLEYTNGAIIRGRGNASTELSKTVIVHPNQETFWSPVVEWWLIVR